MQGVPVDQCDIHPNEIQAASSEQGDKSRTQTESIRAVLTRSQAKASSDSKCKMADGNLWSSEQDKIKLRTLQENDPDLSVIVRALSTGQKPNHSEIVSLSLLKTPFQ